MDKPTKREFLELIADMKDDEELKFYIWEYETKDSNEAQRVSYGEINGINSRRNVIHIDARYEGEEIIG